MREVSIKQTPPESTIQSISYDSNIKPSLCKPTTKVSRWGRNVLVKSDDVEMNKMDLTHELPSQREAVIRNIFHLETHAIANWPGVQLYVAYIEEQFKLVGPTRFESMWRALQYPLPPTLEDCLQFVSLVATTCRKLPSGLSINEILQAVLESASNFSLNHTNDARLAAMNKQAIFTVVAWLTMVVRPSIKLSEENFHIIVEKRLESLQTIQSLDSSTAPIFSLLRGFGCIIPCESTERLKARDSTLINISSLNFFHLKTVGRVNIRWTYSLDSHLKFEPRSRTLSLFAFPSFCALNILAERTGGSIFDRILYDGHCGQSQDVSYISSYKREVLLSYRLLFAKTKARKVFRRSERKKIPGLKKRYDPLLDTLCGEAAGLALPSELWLETWLDFAGNLYEQETYSIVNDFPIFGPRLLELQTFSSSQKAKTIWDIWRDRRNSIQWYTFWAVILIGGLALIMSTVQMALAAAQLRAM